MLPTLTLPLILAKVINDLVLNELYRTKKILLGRYRLLVVHAVPQEVGSRGGFKRWVQEVGSRGGFKNSKRWVGASILR